MEAHLFLFFVNFFYIAGRAFQQLNVVHHKRMWLIATSLFLSIFEVALYGTISVKAYQSLQSGQWYLFATLAAPLWLGGSFGSLASMEIHRKFR